VVEDRIAGRYVLGEEVGRGGMARVVAARDLRLHRRVAIKLLPISAHDPSPARQRFVREARAAAAFVHPHAVAVYDAGVADDVLYIVMELVEGETLAARIARGPLDVEEAVRIADEVLQALAAAHRAGIVHRDVKPGNVLLDAAGAAKLADFGIAKRFADAAADVTTTGLIVGTPNYLAPEQLAGEPVTPAVDIYATGVVLFEMLTARRPYPGTSPIDIALARRDHGPPDVRTWRADAPSHVAAVIATALAVDPAHRYGSAEAMRAALGTPGPAAGTTAALPPPAPVVVPPTALMPATRPGTRRHVWWWLAVAAAVVAATVAIALGRDTDPDAVVPSTSAAAPASAPAVPTTVAPTTVAPTTAVPTTVAPTPPPTTTPPTPAPTAAPTSLAELVALVAADPERFGPHADQLARDLGRLTGREGAQQARDVERLLGRLDDWTGDGSLSPEAAALVRALLPVEPDGDEGGDD
jgi:hypothetical protein